jgi:thiol-disulfide isomerase/thioredoxin
MRQKINYLRHLAVLFLTIMVFIIGIYFGTLAEDLRVQKLYDNLKTNTLAYQSLQTELSYIDFLLSTNQINNKSCKTIKGAYFTSIKNLDDARLKLENYINYAKVKEEDFYRLKNEYLDMEINYYILAEKIKKACGNMNIILYFYGDDKKCPSCQDEGVHLTYVKEKLKDNVLIFALDTSRDGPVKLLMQKYDVQHRELPVLVINDNVTGFKTNQEIFKMLNYSFK